MIWISEEQEEGEEVQTNTAVIRVNGNISHMYFAGSNFPRIKNVILGTHISAAGALFWCEFGFLRAYHYCADRTLTEYTTSWSIE